MPRGLAHAYYNNTATADPGAVLGHARPASCKALFDQLHDLTDIAEAIRISALHEVDFMT